MLIFLLVLIVKTFSPWSSLVFRFVGDCVFVSSDWSRRSFVFHIHTPFFPFLFPFSCCSFPFLNFGLVSASDFLCGSVGDHAADDYDDQSTFSVALCLSSSFFSFSFFSLTHLPTHSHTQQANTLFWFCDPTSCSVDQKRFFQSISSFLHAVVCRCPRMHFVARASCVLYSRHFSNFLSPSLFPRVLELVFWVSSSSHFVTFCLWLVEIGLQTIFKPFLISDFAAVFTSLISWSICAHTISTWSQLTFKTTRWLQRRTDSLWTVRTCERT